MKTVIDAVNYFRGNLNGNFWVHHGLGKASWIITPPNAKVFMSEFICDSQQLNSLALELSTNFGASITYAEYKKEFEYMTTPTIDYTSEEFWKDAPEGATHYWPRMGAFYDFTNKSNGKVFVNSKEWSECSNYECFDDELTPHHKPSPVFTQAMADNGELPSVGMKCQTSTGILTVKYVGKKVVVSENSHGEEFMTSKKSALHSFKPIDTRTDKEKAIDGIRLSCGFNKLNTMENDLLSKAYDAWSKS